MTQNRKPPAFQEYAATLLADKQFRLMNLEERGLLFSMRLECWVNHEIPNLASDLAKYLGQETADVESALTARVKSFFKESKNGFICPELEDYRQYLNNRKTKQSEGGKRGAEKVNKASKEAKELAERSGASQTAYSSGNPASTPQLACESLVKHSSVKLSPNKLSMKEVDQKWVSDYDRASNGS